MEIDPTLSGDASFPTGNGTLYPSWGPEGVTMKGNSFLYIPKYHAPLKDPPALDAVTAFSLD